LRKDVWNNLNKAKTATEIAKELGRYRSAVSRVLLDMEKAGFVKCVNPEDKSFRHYVKK
jgi:predicted transcriptional regulator